MGANEPAHVGTPWGVASTAVMQVEVISDNHKTLDLWRARRTAAVSLDPRCLVLQSREGADPRREVGDPRERATLEDFRDLFDELVDDLMDGLEEEGYI